MLAMIIKTPEKLKQSQILDWLHLRGIKAYRINAGMIKSESGRMIKLAPAGFSDIVGVLKGGQALFIEVKTGNNKPTFYQELFLADMVKQGAVAFVAYGIEDCEENLITTKKTETKGKQGRGKVTAGKRL